ncbi:colanic acid biosynthesis glycosyltransferase WcaL [Paracoccus aestuarii]|uniref:Colanic acid biosynthesis glycosyltransferase WcaL n=1 Tax=Paracoccus aestuarii TaxID=453842 RepID=A0A418ZRJ8_9RHOB|nr:exopolysaccharide biosynthesis GT4 family glycosyltransferase EpsE [Paracoccus aestuarii]RJK98577.1 colanic acid biosynthesis glycosyltransferase WcaL [Paracoccus aestuarii]
MTRTLGYLVPEFPGQTHAFFWRELNAIEDMGVKVQLYSTRKPPDGSCPHGFADPAIRRTHYLFPPALNVDMIKGAHPRRLARAFAYLLALRDISVRERMKVAALLPSAWSLVSHAKRHKVSHVHIHSCANAAHLGALAHILGDLPYSLTLHGDLPVYGKSHPSKMRQARFVSAVTRPLAQQIKAISPETQAPVIWMGVDCTRFAPVHGVRSRNGRFTLTTVARLNHNKGHRFVLRAMAKLRNRGIMLHYRIAGSGPEESHIKAEIAALDLQDQVTLLGSVAEDGVLNLLQTTDALALTSIRQGEAAPVTVMEAMSCGVPVICSIIGGTTDMISDGDDGFLVEQENVDQIADRIERLMNDPEMAERMGQSARETALRSFDHRKNAEKLVEQIFQAHLS